MPRLSEVVKGHNRTYPNSLWLPYSCPASMSCMVKVQDQAHSGLGQRRVLHTIRWQGYHSTFR